MKNESMHSLLVTILVVVLVIQLISLAEVLTLSSHGPLGSGSVGHITISATGSASAQPTTGTLYLSATGRGKTAAAATLNLSTALTQMNSSLSTYINRNLSLIQTTYYQVYNQTPYYYPYPGYNSYNGFVATEELTVTIPNAQNLSAAVGALSTVNGIAVSSASETLSSAQTTTLRNTAFTSAIQNATSQASILTGGAALSEQNITVGYYNFYPLPYAGGVAAGSNGAGNITTTISPAFYSGTSTVTVSITVTFSYSK